MSDEYTKAAGKCKCDDCPGYTTIACCNLCGKPIPTEPWSIPEIAALEQDNARLREALEQYRHLTLCDMEGMQPPTPADWDAALEKANDALGDAK